MWVSSKLARTYSSTAQCALLSFARALPGCHVAEGCVLLWSTGMGTVLLQVPVGTWWYRIGVRPTPHILFTLFYSRQWQGWLALASHNDHQAQIKITAVTHFEINYLLRDAQRSAWLYQEELLLIFLSLHLNIYSSYGIDSAQINQKCGIKTSSVNPKRSIWPQLLINLTSTDR